MSTNGVPNVVRSEHKFRSFPIASLIQGCLISNLDTMVSRRNLLIWGQRNHAGMITRKKRNLQNSRRQKPKASARVSAPRDAPLDSRPSLASAAVHLFLKVYAAKRYCNRR